MDDELQKLLKTVTSGLTSLEQIETDKTKRKYTVIAKKGESKLWMNVDFAASKAQVVGSKKVQDIHNALTLVIRFMEKSAHGEHAFTCFKERAAEQQVPDGWYRYYPILIPVCSVPAPNDYIREKWEKQEVTQKTRDWLKAKITAFGAEMALSDEAFDSLLQSPLDTKPSEEQLYFKLPD